MICVEFSVVTFARLLGSFATLITMREVSAFSESVKNARG